MSARTLTDKNPRLDWLKGAKNNPKGVLITVTNSDPGGGDQRSTIAVANAGTSGKTTAQLAASINKKHFP